MANFGEIERLENVARMRTVHIKRKLLELRNYETLKHHYPRCFMCLKCTDFCKTRWDMPDPWGVGDEYYGCHRCVKNVNTLLRKGLSEYDAFMQLFDAEKEWLLYYIKNYRNKKI